MINITLIQEPDAIFEYRQIWNGLFDNGNFEPSTSFEWTNALRINHAELFTKFFLLIVKRNQDLVGILPFIAKEDRFFTSRLTTIMPISELYNTHSDLLTLEYSDEFCKELLNNLLNLPFKWDIFRTTRFLDNHPFISLFQTTLLNKQINYRCRYENPSFFLKLNNNFDSYLSNRDGKFRNYLKRMQKKLANKGNIEFINVTTTDDYNHTYETLLNIERRSWKHNHGTAISAVDRQVGFYHSLCYEGLKLGRLRLLFLYVNDIPIAYDLGYIVDDQYFYLKTSFDESYKATSPATVLRAQLINLLIADGIQYFDFPGEPYSWEKQWADELRWHKSLIIYNKTHNAFLYKLLTTLKELCRKRNTEKVFYFHDPRKLKHPRN